MYNVQRAESIAFAIHISRLNVEIPMVTFMGGKVQVYVSKVKFTSVGAFRPAE